jgi:tetratricopeptide (TPR) repeat protein
VNIARAIAFFLLLLSFTSSAQNQAKIDSLNVVIESETNEVELAEAYRALAWEYVMRDPDTSFIIAEQALQRFEKLDDQTGVARALNIKGVSFWMKGDYDQAKNYISQSLEISKKEGSKKGIASALTNLGILSHNQGRYSEALDYDYQALNYHQETENKQGETNTRNNIAIVLESQGDLDGALVQLQQALKLQRELGNVLGEATALNNLGGLLHKKGDYHTSLNYFMKSLEMHLNLDNPSALGNCYFKIADSYFSQKKYPEALENFKDSYAQFLIIGNKRQLAFALIAMAGAHWKLKQSNEALEAVLTGASYAKTTGALDMLSEAYELLSEIYESKGDVTQAFHYYRQQVLITDSINNQNDARREIEAAVKYEYLQRQWTDSLQLIEKEKLKALKAEENERIRSLREKKDKEALQLQTWINYIGAIGFLLMCGLAFLLFRGNQVKQKANAQLVLQEAKTKRQKELAEKANENLTDSINYAKRIQDAILPPSELVKQTLPDSFVLYRPRDIVSGDFYWITPVTTTVEGNPEFSLFAAVDCTGHGVPGAFMSIMGYTYLKLGLTTAEVNCPGDALNFLNEKINDIFKQKGLTEKVDDGMDLALCALNYTTNQLHFAGAKNPVYIIRNKELIEIKGDKHPIGASDKDTLPVFTNHIVDVEKGDMVYVSTDGYPDQFGGEKGRKFMTKRFKELLIEISDLSTEDQRKALIEKHEQWRGKLQQVDDICVIGVRI